MNVKLENTVDKLVEKLWKREYSWRSLEVYKNYSSYGEGKGKFQKAYHELYEELIPKKYGCSDAGSEALRVLSQAYYRFYNDGDKVPQEVYSLVNNFLKA